MKILNLGFICTTPYYIGCTTKAALSVQSLYKTGLMENDTKNEET